MRYLLTTTATAALLALTPAAAQQQSDPQTRPSSQPAQSGGQQAQLNEMDRQFVEQAAVSNQFEIRAAELAQNKTGSQEIEQFAQAMIDDHTKLVAELEQIVQPLAVELPKELDQEHRQKIQSLESMSGGAFDRAYVEGQFDAHQRAIALFGRETNEGQSQQLKDFARNTLPMLQGHLQRVQELRQISPEQASNQGSGQSADREQVAAGAGGTARQSSDGTDIQVQQPAPRVIVQQPEPQVTVLQPQPEVTVVQPRPQVTVEQPRPNVTVQTQQPQVEVQQGGQPQVRVQRTGDPQVNVRQPGQEAMPDRQASNQPLQQAASTEETGTGLGAVEAQSLIGGDVMSSGGEDMGNIANLLVGPDGDVRAVVIEWGGFLGLGERRAAVPWEEVQLTPERSGVVINYSEQQIRDLPRYTADQSAMNAWGEGTRAMQ